MIKLLFKISNQVVSDFVYQYTSFHSICRRSTRTRKSVSFCDSVIVTEEDNSDTVEGKENNQTDVPTEDPFSKYLQPMTPRMSRSDESVKN